MTFMRTFWAALLAFIVANIIMGLLFFMTIGGMMAAFSEPVPTVKSNSVLVIDFREGISDSPLSSPLQLSLFSGATIDSRNTLLEALQAIEKASYDSNIKGVYINNNGMDINMTNLEELRVALAKFKESGKFIISYSDVYSQGSYFFASIADKVYLNPEGSLGWQGMAANSLFFTGLLNKLGIEAQIIRHGSYKAAVEPFMLDKMSPENREQNSVMLNTIWGSLLQDVSQSRNIDSAVLSNYATELTLNSSSKALECGMIDGMLYEDQVKDILALMTEGGVTIEEAEYKVLNSDEKLLAQQREAVDEDDDSDDGMIEAAAERAEEELEEALDKIEDKLEGEESEKKVTKGSVAKQPNYISLSKYIASGKYGTTVKTDNKIAIIYADGDIIDGKSQGGSIGGETMAEKIYKARTDKNTKAIVLRINSPGGSALASDIMWRELSLAKEEKPVIVTMGSVAASGGYYIAAPADAILANRTTITGSIGVFGVLFEISGGAKRHLGITTDVVRTNPSADMGSLFRKLTAHEKEVILNSVQQVYGTFIGHVADGRNLTTEYVDEIGGGRVWSGVSALENGLIDGFGGLTDAIALAADRAGVVGDFKLWEVVDQPTGVNQILRSLSGEVSVEGELGEMLKYYNSLKSMLEQQSPIQARMPYMLEIQ